MKHRNLYTGLLLAAITTFPSFQATADTLGITVSAGSWMPDVTGEFTDSATIIDVQQDLGITDTDSGVYSFSFEHFIFLLPNIKVQSTGLDIQSTSIMTTDIIFEDIVYPIGTEVSSQVDLSHVDYILYYEVLDNWVSLDLGLSVLNFNGVISMQSEGQISEIELDEYLPAIYGNASVELPVGFSLGARGNLFSTGDGNIFDYEVYLGWESDFALGAEVGYHQFTLDWEDISDSYGDLSYDGYYASITLHF
ncbi:MAG: hypothetical protein DRQ47_11255 [Gammaproteobacteria bacterium]|nr:MAG: hypothetical protein DRQ47_11255 [Gammaproteobacteria bacterium]